MKLLLIRHAVAVPRGTPGIPDDERPLTPEGEAEFRVAARGLARIVRRPDVLLTSPLPRARVTAEIAALAFKHLEPRVEPALARTSVDGIVAALKTHPPAATVVLVGHEPVLSAVLARLLGASQAERFVFEKGGAALVDLPQGPTTAGQLIWFLDARVLSAVQSTSSRRRDRMAISKKASKRTTSPAREAAGTQSTARSAQSQKAASAAARETQNVRQFAKTGLTAIRAHTQARGQRKQAKRDSR